MLSVTPLFHAQSAVLSRHREQSCGAQSVPSPQSNRSQIPISARREKSRVKCKRAREFYARTTRRANAAGVSCYVHYDLLRSMHTSSLVLNAPTQLRESLKSFGLIATLRCAKSVKLTTRYFQEIPRTFSVRFLAIAF